MTPRTKQILQQSPADVDGEWELLGGIPLIKWDKPKTVNGLYQGFVTVTTEKYGTQKKYAVSDATILVHGTDDPAEEPRAEFFAPAILERVLADPKLQLGDELQIVFTGEDIVTAGGRKAKEFIVKFKRARK